MNKNHSSLIIGLIFILIGAGLLLDKLNMFDFGWYQIYPVLLILISIMSFISIFSGNKNSAFWAGIFGVLGVFFFLRNFDVITAFWFSEYWPIFLLALGAGFILLFIFKPQDWGVLIPGFILTFIGVVFLVNTLNLYDLEEFIRFVFDLVATYWPLALVLLGLGLILNAVSKKTTS